MNFKTFGEFVNKKWILFNELIYYWAIPCSWFPCSIFSCGVAMLSYIVAPYFLLGNLFLMFILNFPFLSLCIAFIYLYLNCIKQCCSFLFLFLKYLYIIIMSSIYYCWAKLPIISLLLKELSILLITFFLLLDSLCLHFQPWNRSGNKSGRAR